MKEIEEKIINIKSKLPDNVQLIVVTKMFPVEVINEAYLAGERNFGENRPQEMVEKHSVMPNDILWHQIGSLQTNKVRSIIPFVHMIHSIDSAKLLEFVNKEAFRINRVVDVLMEVDIAQEDTKHGWKVDELLEYLKSDSFKALSNIKVCGVMGMATYTDDKEQVRREFRSLKSVFENVKNIISSVETISMGMSGDYEIAVEEGATMVRIGSSIFGKRNYK
ncbi:MAG: YggS family pyridoxal phosphate-dependent enzyme [Rikenellaceae bacterium]